MKRFALFFGIAAWLVASCSVQEEGFKTTQQDDVIYYASFEQPAEEGTRVYANEDLLLRWTADDKVSIFGKNTYNQQYKFLGETGDNSGGFGKVDVAEYVTGNPISHTVSVYPYQASTKITEDEVLTVTLPAEQHYAENTFGLGANTMVSVSEDNFLQYKNVGGYLMLKLYGGGVTVSSITLKGNNGEKLAGKASVTMPLDGMPTAVMSEDATTEITLVCDTPIALGSTPNESVDFWFVVPPVTFSKGFSITISKTSGGFFEKSTTNKITIERSKLSKMSLMEIEPQPNDAIFYTSTDGRVVTPTSADAFGANIVSNKYINGLGVIQFDGEVVSVGNTAFANCERLVSISIPRTVTSIGKDAFVNCIELVSVDIPEGVTSIGTSAFSCCYKLRSIALPYGVTVIERATFANSIGLVSVTLPDSLTEIRESAFDTCSSLSMITLPNHLERIEFGAFCGTALSSVCIPDSIVYLSEGAFFGCNSLVSFSGKYARANGEFLANDGVLLAYVSKGAEDYTVPSSITKIGSYTFSLTTLKRITIPSNVEIIGDWAFSYSYSLESITVNNLIPPSGGKGMLYETNNAPIYVPAESVEAYKTAEYWSEYADRIQAIPSVIPIPEAVDMGLPSGLKWASFNLGASKPEEFGDYYAWGETEPYYICQDPLTWKEGKENGYEWASYKWCMGVVDTMTRYCDDPSCGYNGFTDTKVFLDQNDDAASVNLGSNWRIPTYEEWIELMDNCKWAWTQENGVNGYKVISKQGSNSIFLPAVGLRYSISLIDAGTSAYYWSSSLYESVPDYYEKNPAEAMGLYFNSVYASRNSASRYHGGSIRPVCN